jgi:phosphate transport system substrate-binding protein
MQPLVDAAAKQYAKDCPGATISVQGGGSGTGLTQVLQGAVQIGNSDIFAEDKLKADEAAQLVDHQVVRQGFVVVLKKASPASRTSRRSSSRTSGPARSRTGRTSAATTRRSS